MPALFGEAGSEVCLPRVARGLPAAAQLCSSPRPFSSSHPVMGSHVFIHSPVRQTVTARLLRAKPGTDVLTFLLKPFPPPLPEVWSGVSRGPRRPLCDKHMFLLNLGVGGGPLALPVSCCAFRPLFRHTLTRIFEAHARWLWALGFSGETSVPSLSSESAWVTRVSVSRGPT